VTLLDELKARATGSVLQTPVWTLSPTEAYRLAYREAADLVAADPLYKAALELQQLARDFTNWMVPGLRKSFADGIDEYCREWDVFYERFQATLPKERVADPVVMLPCVRCGTPILVDSRHPPAVVRHDNLAYCFPKEG
jgi:hypothetical protein